MILTDYYKFVHLSEIKSRTRLECVCSTKSYPNLDLLRNKKGVLFAHCTDVPEHFKADVQRKADKCLSNVKNISSLFFPDLNQKHLGYGDIKGASDAILVVCNGDFTEIEIFVARGYRNNRLNLWQNLASGELDDEISALRNRAVTEMEIKKNQ